jgi:hypothetical protein
LESQFVHNIDLINETGRKKVRKMYF